MGEGISHKPQVALTVAICTRDRRESLLRAVASLAASDAQGWELLIVDNGSADDTRAACEALVDDFPAPMRVVTEPVAGLSHARNRALAVAAGRALVFVDDDATCRAGFVAAHARAFQSPDVVATGGRILPVLPAHVRGAWRRHLEREIGGPTGHYAFGASARAIDADAGIAMPFGGNLGVRRSDVLDAGGFRTDLGFGGELVPGEETELLMRLSQRGRVIYVGDAVIDHHLDPARLTLDYYRRWHRGYGRALVRMGAVSPTSALAIARAAARPLARALRDGEPYRALRGIERARGQWLELRDRRRKDG